jgi:membrane-associated protease RseP (regulator of RpoE activity)
MILYLFAWCAGLAGAIAAHELGHWSAARALGYPARIVMTFAGPGTLWGSDTTISPRAHRMIVSAAGPVASAVLAVSAYVSGGLVLAACSAMVLAPQLVPVGRSDAANFIRARKR